jgi:hypothetical protein
MARGAGVEDSALPLTLTGDEGQVRLAAMGHYRTAVIASLRGQIAEGRGAYDEARLFYEAGLAADERFTVNRLQLRHLR